VKTCLEVVVLTLLVIHLHQLRSLVIGAVNDRRHGEVGAMNTLEMVVLALGAVAIAAIAMAAFREAVSSRVSQLK
jgi:hypothetical protein